MTIAKYAGCIDARPEEEEEETGRGGEEEIVPTASVSFSPLLPVSSSPFL
jgi:hypothetical protein